MKDMDGKDETTAASEVEDEDDLHAMTEDRRMAEKHRREAELEREAG